MPAETAKIRPARPDDLDRLAAIEIDAFKTLLTAGGVEGEARPMPHAALEASLAAGLLWVAAADPYDRPVAFLAAARLDEMLYIAEIDVAPDWQRRGLGRRLMATAINHARMRRLSGVTLTTDRFVAFNAPFYASLGFVPIIASDAVPALRGRLASEIAAGMSAERRVAMILRFA